MKEILQIQKRNKKTEPFQLEKIIKNCQRILGSDNWKLIENEFLSMIKNQNFNNFSTSKIIETLIWISISKIENDPIYEKFAKKLLLEKLYRSVFQQKFTQLNLENLYRQFFIKGIKGNKIFKKELTEKFNLEKLSETLVIERDQELNYLGLETLTQRYFVFNKENTENNHILETPQAFWMRISMGISIKEENPTQKAIEFYNLISQLFFIPSTPTLLHSGLVRSQLSSCFLASVDDDLEHIFKSYWNIASLLKYSGGMANDWTNLRSINTDIKSINAETTGLIPFLKIANSVTQAINRSGKRRGASVAYLEIFHSEIESFCDLRRNDGDERRRTHDLNLAVWIPDLFMKRVINRQTWTLFSPNEVSDLHHLYGNKFEKRYLEYEKMIEENEGKFNYKKIDAFSLWRKIITCLVETGYPWITFKDSCNIRSPQDHVGVVHCSNLCTEITLNTSKEEIAVCNLGSVNLAKHIDVQNKKLNEKMFEKTIKTAIRILDNVIDPDINFYPVPETRKANLLHRPIGLGMMGFQDALFKMDLDYENPEILNFTDQLTEKFSYYAIKGSSELANERGVYETYKGSKWDRNIFPFDTLELLEKEREKKIIVSRKKSLNWEELREYVKKNGMRNSNTMAIAPTATIANIAGCYPCIEPIYSNLYVKSNMSGEFTVINKYLIAELKKRNIWNQKIIDQIKFYNGSIQKLQIDQKLKNKYKTAFEISPELMIELTALRSKWIDQSISHNVFYDGNSGIRLSNLYFKAWDLGMKTTYYLRTLGASQVEKSTLGTEFGFTQKRNEKDSCSLTSDLDSDCEACQ
jgi:ribonucleoside-diphosphate reductase alpha chain